MLRVESTHQTYSNESENMYLVQTVETTEGDNHTYHYSGKFLLDGPLTLDEAKDEQKSRIAYARREHCEDNSYTEHPLGCSSETWWGQTDITVQIVKIIESENMRQIKTIATEGYTVTYVKEAGRLQGHIHVTQEPHMVEAFDVTFDNETHAIACVVEKFHTTFHS